MRRALSLIVLALAAGPALAADPCVSKSGTTIAVSSQSDRAARGEPALPAVWARMAIMGVERKADETAYVLAVDSVESAKVLQARDGASLSGKLVERNGRVEIVCAPGAQVAAVR